MFSIVTCLWQPGYDTHENGETHSLSCFVICLHQNRKSVWNLATSPYSAVCNECLMTDHYCPIDMINFRRYTLIDLERDSSHITARAVCVLSGRTSRVIGNSPVGPARVQSIGRVRNSLSAFIIANVNFGSRFIFWQPQLGTSHLNISSFGFTSWCSSPEDSQRCFFESWRSPKHCGNEPYQWFAL